MIVYYKLGKSVKLHCADINEELFTLFIERSLYLHGTFALVDIREKPIKPVKIRSIYGTNNNERKGQNDT